jgi:hypothetical protein
VSTSSEERPRLLEAFYPLDPDLAKQLAAQLPNVGTSAQENGWRDEARRNKRGAKARVEDAVRLQKKLAQLEKSGADYISILGTLTSLQIETRMPCSTARTKPGDREVKARPSAALSTAAEW